VVGTLGTCRRDELLQFSAGEFSRFAPFIPVKPGGGLFLQPPVAPV
jgi:hypothetical protein